MFPRSRRIEADDEYSSVSAIKEAFSPCSIITTKKLTNDATFVRALTGKTAPVPSDADRETVTMTETDTHRTVETFGTCDSAPSITATSRTESVVSPCESSSRIQVVPSTSNHDHDTESSIIHTAERFLRTIQASECTIEKANEFISMTSIPSMPDNCSTPKQRLSFFSHIFQGHSVALRATGGLLSFCIGNHILCPLEENGTLLVNSIKHGNVGVEGMLLSSTSSLALNIFQHDYHPAGRGAGKNKEWGIFGILAAELKSKASCHTLRSWIRNPLTNVQHILHRQAVVTAFRSPACHTFAHSIREALKKVKNMPTVITRIRTYAASVSEWLSLYQCSQQFIIILDSLNKMAHTDPNLIDVPLFQQIRDTNVHHLHQIVSYIEEVIDFDESKAEHRLVVTHGFNSEVDELRDFLAGINSMLTEVGKQEMRSMISTKPAGVELSSMEFRYETNIGFLVYVEESDVSRYGLDKLKDAGFEFHHINGFGHQMFKNEKCRELDHEIGDVHGSLVNLESKVLHFLERKIYPTIQTAYNVAKIVAQIDSLQAMANAAEEYSWIRPTVSDQAQGIRIENGRHCLLDITLPNFVPNDTNMRLGQVGVITGPNQAGKSVFLKQVGLIVFLSQIGSCVPATAAEIRPMHAIFTRMISFDTISEGRSSFFADCAQVAGFLRSPKKPVLALLDEFGNGTADVDGVALCAAVLRTLLNRADESSITLATTHKIEIFNNGMMPLTNPALNTYSMEMVAVEEYKSSKKAKTTNDDSNSQSYTAAAVDKETKHVRTFRVIPGSICSESRAVQCALENGIPRNLLGHIMHIKEKVSGSDKNAKHSFISHLSTRRPGARKTSQIVKRFVDFNFEETEIESSK